MFRNLIRQTAASLDEAQVPYMIIGGQAVLLYGEPRLTKDIDITLGVDVDELARIVKIAQKLDFVILVENTEEFVRETMVLPTEDKKSGIRIDFIFSFSPYEKQAIERATIVRMNDTPVRFASLEDVIVHKIVAGRARDIEDVESILLKNPGFDVGYVEFWLEKFDESLAAEFLKSFQQIREKLFHSGR